MANIIGGIGCSHAPSVAVAFDRGHAERAEWKPFFDSAVPVKSWLTGLKPDTLIVFYNDHLNRFPLSTYPTFAIGCDDVLPVADEVATGAAPCSRSSRRQRIGVAFVSQPGRRRVRHHHVPGDGWSIMAC